MPGTPRIALEIVDVRDVAELHIQAMTNPAAAGQRVLATGDLMWMNEMAKSLQEGIANQASRVSTRQLPDFVVKFMARFVDTSLREITPALGRRARHTSQKAETDLGWKRRPATATIIDCANSLISWKVV